MSGGLKRSCSQLKLNNTGRMLKFYFILFLHFDISSQFIGSLRENQFGVFRQIFTSISMTGTSMSTPTTVASAAPEDKPKSIVAVAMATSK